MRSAELSRSVDLLVVGTGPAGAAVARAVASVGRWRVLAVDAGAQLTAVPGRNLRNVAARDRPSLLRLAQGRFGQPGDTQGTAPLVQGPGELRHISGSTCVGGMGVVWSGATPRPRSRERPDFVPDDELDHALGQAERWLGVNQDPLGADPAVLAMRRRAGAVRSATVAGTRALPMPLACKVLADGSLEWSGSDTILAGAGHDRPEIRPLTLARRLLLDDRSAVLGVELVDLTAGASYAVPVRACVVAADALRGPQLLWVSGVRGPALGRYFNDHLLVNAALALPGRARSVPRSPQDDPRDLVTGVTWLPCDLEAGAGHCQVLHMPGPRGQPLSEHAMNGGAVAVLGWYVPNALAEANRVLFDDGRQDAYGMPGISVEHRLLAEDESRVGLAMDELSRLEDGTLGFLPGCGPRLQPVGTSMHYQGTLRMGEADDGASVCAHDGRVWGTANVFVAGNGLLSTMTATNPTLTSVAHALRTARSVLRLLAR